MIRHLFELVCKMFFGAVMFPPALMLYRFVAWAMCQDHDAARSCEGSSAEAGAQ